MKRDIIYVLHKQGANSHYTGLDFLLKKHSTNLKFREFSIFTKTFKAIRTFDFKTLKKQAVNFSFLINLLFSKNKKIVLGIAPFDHKILFILKILKNHTIYYHTSWAHWDKTFHPKTKKNSEKVFNAWRYFLEEKCNHIFCVNKKGKNGLLTNYNLPSKKISVVYHSLPPEFSTVSTEIKKEKSFIYVGRLVAQKGLEEILAYFAEHEEASLTIIGRGDRRAIVEKYSKLNRNIHYQDFLKNKTELKKAFARHQYLLLNSKREELFGMVIIEAMSQGTIPVASSLSGPSEIISPETGFLFEEGKVTKMLDTLLEKEFDTEPLSNNSIIKSREYQLNKIARNWQAILN